VNTVPLTLSDYRIGKATRRGVKVPQRVYPRVTAVSSAEIGDIKHETLPTQTGDTPFATGGEDSGPHTKTFPKGDQANPVTHETQASNNPLSELLTSEWPADAVVRSAYTLSVASAQRGYCRPCSVA
jgi:hypothetical protein